MNATSRVAGAAPVAAPGAEHLLSVDAACVAIQGTAVLHDVSLTVAKGEMLGLIGHNGAGKTTLLKALMGLHPLTSGAVRFDGTVLSSQPAHRRAALGIGYMPEDRRLIPTLNVQENILLPGWQVGLKDLPERLAEIYARIPELASVVDRPALTLSGGQQKLAALARAMIVGDRLLLLDEPFEGVAPALVVRLHEIVGSLRGESRAVLICDSSLDRERDNYTRFAFIERGEVNADGTEGGVS